MIAYKVVYKSEDGLLSFAALGHYGVIYIPDEWVWPRVEGTMLFVFDTLSAARVFLSKHRLCAYEVWECEVEGCVAAAPRLPCNTIQYMAWWETHQEKPLYWHELITFITPEGTMFAERVKLVKKVA